MAQGIQQESFKDQAAEQCRTAAERAQDLAGAAAERLRDSSAGEVAGNFRGALDRSLRDQPITTVAMAVAFGFVLGALWRS
jgi:ElaB/YqjD/DUF883 family membrane-anchored ribosome-binding protein